MRKILLTAAIIGLFSASAFAQYSGGGVSGAAVGQTGTITANDVAVFAGDRLLKDGGSSTALASAFNASSASTGYKLNGANAIFFPSNDTTAGASVGVGSGALSGQTGASAAYSNTALGRNVLSATLTTAAVSNLGIGNLALANVTTGDSNTGIGNNAGGNLSTGQSNTFVGKGSGGGNGGTLTGFNITAIGVGSASAITSTADTDTIIGANAGSTITTGKNNTVIGSSVASSTLTTGSNNILIGVDNSTTTASASTSNTVLIKGSGTAVLSATGTNGTPVTSVGGTILMPNMANVNTTVTGAVCWNTGGAVTYNSSTTCLLSSARYKNIKGQVRNGLDEVMKLKPTTYTYKNDRNHYGEQVGFIAEDVEKLDKRLVAYDPKGLPQTVRYENLTAILAKAIQEQQTEISELRREVRALYRK